MAERLREAAEAEAAAAVECEVLLIMPGLSFRGIDVAIEPLDSSWRREPLLQPALRSRATIHGPGRQNERGKWRQRHIGRPPTRS